MSGLMVSVSGVRGIVGEALTPQVALNFALAFGTYVKGGKVVVGRDSRVTGEMLRNAVLAGLSSVGCDVVDIGVCPTPTTQLAVENLQAAGGIMITASHNPIMWNGLKLIGPDGLFLDADQGQEVLKLKDSGAFPFVTWREIGKGTPYPQAVRDHIEAILRLDFIQPEAIRARNFKVALDCVCGAGANLVPTLLERLGCAVVCLNCEATGLFPRNPEPLPENLTELCEAVRREHADIGFAVDPDSDRLAIVSEKGEPIGEEKTLALAVKFVLNKKLGPVVINASTSLVTEDVAAEFGVPVIRTKVGEVHVARKMREQRAVIGGEGNGGVILPDVHLGRDAPVGIALILQLLAGCGESVGSLNEQLPQYVIAKNKVALRDLDSQAVLQKLRETYSRETLDLTDGLKILREKSWVHIRPSNTEPIIRVIAEAPTRELADRLCQEVMDQIG